jgi:hypothetical protein
VHVASPEVQRADPARTTGGESVMTHDEFHIGETFWTAAGQFKRTDVGTRTIVAVAIGAKEIADPSWLNGPPYAVAELVFDEDDLEACTLAPVEFGRTFDASTVTTAAVPPSSVVNSTS